MITKTKTKIKLITTFNLKLINPAVTKLTPSIKLQ